MTVENHCKKIVFQSLPLAKIGVWICESSMKGLRNHYLRGQILEELHRLAPCSKKHHLSYMPLFQAPRKKIVPGNSNNRLFLYIPIKWWVSNPLAARNRGAWALKVVWWSERLNSSPARRLGPMGKPDVATLWHNKYAFLPLKTNGIFYPF